MPSYSLLLIAALATVQASAKCMGRFVSNEGKVYKRQKAVKVKDNLYVFYSKAEGPYMKMAGVDSDGTLVESRFYDTDTCDDTDEKCVNKHWAKANIQKKGGYYKVKDVICEKKGDKDRRLENNPTTQVGSTAAGVTLVTFDGASGTCFEFQELNDPVMGGKSNGTWNVDSQGKFGVFDGDVVDVPSLKAPGFIKAAAMGKFPDASAMAGGDLVLSVRTTTPEYRGFRVSFASGAVSSAYACAGGGTLPLSSGCFKAKFSVPAGTSFTTVKIPFSSFSDNWSPATGEQIKTCADNADVCPTAKKLAAIQRVEVWAEGVSGKAHLEIQSISAEPSALSGPTEAIMV